MSITMRRFESDRDGTMRAGPERIDLSADEATEAAEAVASGRPFLRVSDDGTRSFMTEAEFVRATIADHPEILGTAPDAPSAAAREEAIAAAAADALRACDRITSTFGRR